MQTLLTTTRITLVALLLATTAVTSIAQNKHIEITPQLQAALDKYLFHDDYTCGDNSDLIRVFKNGKYGLVNTSGKEITKCKYDYIRDFSNGFSAVLIVDSNKKDKWGLINTIGKEVVPCIYDKISILSNDLANVTLNDKIGLINTAGKVVVPCNYDSEIIFNDNYAAVSIDNKWGFIDNSYNEFVPCKYDFVWDFEDNLAMVEKDEKMGLVDITGKEVIPCDFYAIKVLDDDLAKVKQENKIGLFSIKRNQIIIPCEYDNVYSFSEGLAKVILNGKYGMVNNLGTVIVPCEYDVVKKINGNLIVVKSNEKFGFFNTIGKQISECQYDQACIFHDGIARVAMGNWSDSKFGYIDSKGIEIVPCSYDYATDFSNGIARVGVNEKSEDYYTYTKYNFINTQGNVIVPWDKYDHIGNAVDGFILVKSNDKYGFINASGQEVVPCKYEAENLHFENGLARVKHNGKWGFINNHGEEVIPCTLDYAYRFQDGEADVISKGEYETIDTLGNIISSKALTLSDVGWLGGQWKTGEEVKNPLYLNINNNDNEKNTVSFFKKGKEIVLDAQLVYNSNDNCYILKCTNKDINYIVDMDKMELIDMSSNLALTPYDPYYFPGLDISGKVLETVVLDKSIVYEQEHDYFGGYDYMEKPMKHRPEPKPQYEEVFKSAAHMPSFPGGDAALMNYINKSTSYPKVAQDNGVQGKVIVQFVIEKDGSIGEVMVVRGVDKDLDREAVRVCKTLPRFNPGRNAYGDPVRVWYTLPITFKLQAAEEDENTSEGEINNQ